MTVRSGLIACFLLFAFVRPAAADLFSNVDLEMNLISGGTSCSSSFGTTSCTINGTARGINNTPPPPLIPVNVGGYATSVAHYGSLETDVNIGISGGVPSTGWNNTFRAGFSDTLSVGGYSGSGFIEYKWTGTAFNFDNTFNGGCITGIIGCPLGTETELLPFTGDTPISLGKSHQAYSVSLGGEVPGVGSYELTLDQIELFDSNMNPITGYTLESASGTAYPLIGGVDVPELSSVYLLVPAALCFVFTLRKSTVRPGD